MYLNIIRVVFRVFWFKLVEINDVYYGQLTIFDIDIHFLVRFTTVHAHCAMLQLKQMILLSVRFIKYHHNAF